MTTQKPTPTLMEDASLPPSAAMQYGDRWPIGWTADEAWARLRAALERLEELSGNPGELDALRAENAALKVKLEEAEKHLIWVVRTAARGYDNPWGIPVPVLLGRFMILNDGSHGPTTGGTYACPYCGRSGFHTHSPQEVVIYRNGLKYGMSVAAVSNTGDLEEAIHNAEVSDSLHRDAVKLMQESDSALVESESRATELAASLQEWERLVRSVADANPQFAGDYRGIISTHARWATRLLSSTPAADLSAYTERIRRETVGNCHWAQDDYGWRTQCGGFWIFNGDGTDGTPEENGALFCHHCGKHLVPVTNEDPAAGIEEPNRSKE